MTEKIRIAFVDDEAHILRGLRRSMLDMEDQWDMSFYGSGGEAIAAMERQPVDAIVSDMRMPGMDGGELLNRVRKLWPQTIRIILSGHAEAASVLKTVGPAHAYLAKPCDSKVLHDAIARPLALRRFLSNSSLQAVLGELSSLPSVPALFLEIDRELRSPNASATSVAKILSKDLAMTAEVLKLTNSAFFTLNARISTPLQAVRTLGLETIQTLVLQVGIFRQTNGGASLPMLDALNRHGLAQGRLAEAIAREDGADPATVKAAHCAGMLSCIGSLVLLDHASDRYLQALSSVGPSRSQPSVEIEAFGAAHNHVGAYLLGLWGFADSIVEAVAFADDPAWGPGTDNPVLMAVHAAHALGPSFPLLPKNTDEPEKLDMAYLIDIRKDGSVHRWRQLAAELRSEVDHG